MTGMNTSANVKISTSTYSNDSPTASISPYGHNSVRGYFNISYLINRKINDESWEKNIIGLPLLKSFMKAPWNNEKYKVNTDNANFNLSISVYGNICFLQDTEITTDQGILKIMDINYKKHTINNKKIKCVTKTVTKEKHLVCIKQNSFGENIPCKDIYTTNNHKVLYNGSLIESYKLVNIIKGVTHTPYKGEYLYNIIMKQHEIIEINNLCFETLHPSYLKTFKLIQLYDSIQKNNNESRKLKRVIMDRINGIISKRCDEKNTKRLSL
jgi:hypothetical protein